jgi:hypothetical protein
VAEEKNPHFFGEPSCFLCVFLNSPSYETPKIAIKKIKGGGGEYKYKLSK